MNRKYNFEEYVNRKNTDSVKWDGMEKEFGKEDLLPFWVADMDFKAPEPVIEAIKKRADQGVFGYTLPGEGFYRAVSSWFAGRHGITVEKEWISYSPGVVTGLTVLVRALTDEGDGIIVQPPVYYPFFSVIRDNGRVIEENPLLYCKDGIYRIDFNDLEKKASDPNVKLLILCSPHNPVSRVWTESELRQVGEICLKNNVVIISDDIHSDFIYGANSYKSFLSLGKELSANSVTLAAPSKTFNMAGLKSSLVISENPEILEKYKKMLQVHSVSGINCLSQAAVEAAYSHGEGYLEQLLEYLQENIDFVIGFMEKAIPEIRVIRPEGTYLLWLDCRGLGLDEKGLDNLFFNQAGIAVDSGHWFGSGGSGFMRLNIGCSRAFLEKGLSLLAGAVSSERAVR